MAFSTTALRHGWVYLTALGIVTGTTIYVMNNTRRQIKPEDIIEIVLGTTERCLATQITTNPTYRVDPPLFVQSWVKTNAPALGRKISGGYKAYVINYTNYWPSTTGVGAVYSYTSSWAKAYPVTEATINYAESWTATGGWVWVTKYWSDWSWIFVTDAYETVTNTIGWYPDRDMMISLDSTIKALVPYYVDTNTVYDGTTNIIMLTVTGLWASLGIGDKTNKFTRTPCWTNPISTNWIINYTSYWPSTNGTTTNINYTSDYRQVVNYAESWTATGGHVWVTSSNWASEVVQTTNAATYGDYPWQIYEADLVERYKVLEALRITRGGAVGFTYRDSSPNNYSYISATNANAWALVKGLAEIAFLADNNTNWYNWAGSPGDIGFEEASYGYSNSGAFFARLVTVQIVTEPQFACTNISLLDRGDYAFGSVAGTNFVFDDNGMGVVEGQWSKIGGFPFGHAQGDIPNWCDQPSGETVIAQGWNWTYQVYPTWDFQYATNKFW